MSFGSAAILVMSAATWAASTPGLAAASGAGVPLIAGTPVPPLRLKPAMAMATTPTTTTPNTAIRRASGRRDWTGAAEVADGHHGGSGPWPGLLAWRRRGGRIGRELRDELVVVQRIGEGSGLGLGGPWRGRDGRGRRRDKGGAVDGRIGQERERLVDRSDLDPGPCLQVGRCALEVVDEPVMGRLDLLRARRRGQAEPREECAFDAGGGGHRRIPSDRRLGCQRAGGA